MARKIWLLWGMFVCVVSSLGWLLGSAPVTAVSPVSPMAADLQISAVAAPNPVMVGDPLTYTLVVQNVGPSIAFSVTIQDLLPTGVDFSMASIRALGGLNSNLFVTPKALTGTVMALQPGGIVTITARTFIGLGATGSTLTNQVHVSAANDDNPGNNSTTVSTGLLALPVTPTGTPTATPVATPTPTATPSPVPRSSDLRISKHSTPDTVLPGQLLTYTILVRNVGSLAAQNVVITDTLPANVFFAGATHIAVERGFAPTLVLTSTTLTGQTGQLNPGGVITITSRTLVGPKVTGVTLNNTAWLVAGSAATASRSNASVSTTLLAAPAPTTVPDYRLYAPLILR